jgi:hypothetical protein
MIYGSPYPDEFTIERNCHECGEEFPADVRDEDDVVCEECRMSEVETKKTGGQR